MGWIIAALVLVVLLLLGWAYLHRKAVREAAQQDREEIRQAVQKGEKWAGDKVGGAIDEGKSFVDREVNKVRSKLP